MENVRFGTFFANSNQQILKLYRKYTPIGDCTCVCFTELAMIEEKGAIIRGFIRNAQTACITADSLYNCRQHAPSRCRNLFTCLPCSHLWGLPGRANPDTTNLLIAPFLELHSVPCCWYRPSWSPLARSANANKTLVLKALITQTQTRVLENVSPALRYSHKTSGDPFLPLLRPRSALPARKPLSNAAISAAHSGVTTARLAPTAEIQSEQFKIKRLN